jgi:hypothetical protein
LKWNLLKWKINQNKWNRKMKNLQISLLMRLNNLFLKRKFLLLFQLMRKRSKRRNKKTRKMVRRWNLLRSSYLKLISRWALR